jgi:hypothetical protein
MNRRRSWIISLGIHVALLLGVAAWFGEQDAVDECDLPDVIHCILPRPIRKVDRIERIRDVFEHRGDVPPQFLGATLAIEEAWRWSPEGVTLFLYFREGQAPCTECIRMMQEAFGERGRKTVAVPRGAGTYVGWSSSIGASDPRPRHPGGCRAYHLLGVDVYCTCCTIIGQRASSMGENPP